jgi:hypothetical protein
LGEGVKNTKSKGPAPLEEADELIPTAVGRYAIDACISTSGGIYYTFSKLPSEKNLSFAGGRLLTAPYGRRYSSDAVRRVVSWPKRPSAMLRKRKSTFLKPGNLAEGEPVKERRMVKKIVNIFMGLAIAIIGLSCMSGKGDKRNVLIPVCRNGQWGYVDQKGKVIIDFHFQEASAF